MVKDNLEGQECRRCHSEHQGGSFVPIRWYPPLSRFDHRRTGYVLEGAHRTLECRKCHTAAHISDTQRSRIKVSDLNRTYLGLSRDCLSCHADEHRGQFSPDCLHCHTLGAWKPASVFDHSRARFVLRGAHQRLACEKCHTRTGDAPGYLKFTGLTFGSCGDCHKDPHRGAFAGACTQCHSETIWKPTQVSSRFDHSRTSFPLTGRHAGLACEKCHRSADFKQPLPHDRCLNCHKDETHRGQFTASASKGECSACHKTDAWKPPTFTAASHDSTAFPLEGKHAGVPCSRCHTSQHNVTLYRVKFGACTDCHQDPHSAQFAAAPHGNRCENCHTVRSFTPSTFTPARHASTRMPLTGAHAPVACIDCHSQAGATPVKPVRFRFDDLSCVACHEDPHKGQFRQRMLVTRPDGSSAGCQACHTENTWREIGAFDHASTAFPLTGSHQGVPCEKCHHPANPGAGLRSAVFRSAPSRCSGCHDDVHAGQFAVASGETDCARCHSVSRWKQVRFDHSQTAFPLAGAHLNAKCGDCHVAQPQPNGKSAVRYRGTPLQCEGCHKVEGQT